MDELQNIAAAAAGLYYLSETDSPFEVHQLDAVAPIVPQLLQLFKRDNTATIEQQDVEFFLRNHTRTYEGATANDEARAERFRRLQELLQQTLINPEVYKIGQIQIDAVITGVTSGGKRIALTTKLVET